MTPVPTVEAHSAMSEVLDAVFAHADSVERLWSRVMEPPHPGPEMANTAAVASHVVYEVFKHGMAVALTVTTDVSRAATRGPSATSTEHNVNVATAKAVTAAAADVPQPRLPALLSQRAVLFDPTTIVTFLPIVVGISVPPMARPLTLDPAPPDHFRSLAVATLDTLLPYATTIVVLTPTDNAPAVAIPTPHTVDPDIASEP
jgi:hypothetical protein